MSATVLIRLPEFDSFEELAWFTDGQCHATTRRGKRCQNPLFRSQWFVPHNGYPGYVVEASEDDYHRWIEGLCPLHYARAEGADR